MKHKVGIVGTGFVGTAVSAGLEYVLREKVDIREYDKFKNTENLDSVVNNSDILFICVPTPTNEDGSCNISIVQGVIKEISEIAEKKKAVVIKSTVPPKTTNNLQKKYNNLSFTMNPEFLTERNAFNDFINQDRIILGYSTTDSVTLKVKKLYEEFTKSQPIAGKIYETQDSIAEMLKYVTNCFLATKLSFFNEIYEICSATGVVYGDLIPLLNVDGRIGKSHLQVPGPDGQFGFSLSCFPKDINALIAFAKEVGVDPLMLESTWTKNLLVREDHDWEKLPQFHGKYGNKNE